MALSVPLIVQFFVYILASAAGSHLPARRGIRHSGLLSGRVHGERRERPLAARRPDAPDGAADRAEHGAPLHRRDSDRDRGDKAGREPARDEGGLGQDIGEERASLPLLLSTRTVLER